jgi:hypothetical protein
MQIYLHGKKNSPKLLLKYEEPQDSKAVSGLENPVQKISQNKNKGSLLGDAKLISKITIDVQQDSFGEISYCLDIKYPCSRDKSFLESKMGRMIINESKTKSNVHLFGSNLKKKNDGRLSEEEDSYQNLVRGLNQRGFETFSREGTKSKKNFFFEHNGSLYGSDVMRTGNTEEAARTRRERNLRRRASVSDQEVVPHVRCHFLENSVNEERFMDQGSYSIFIYTVVKLFLI